MGYIPLVTLPVLCPRVGILGGGGIFFCFFLTLLDGHTNIFCQIFRKSWYFAYRGITFSTMINLTLVPWLELRFGDNNLLKIHKLLWQFFLNFVLAGKLYNFDLTQKHCDLSNKWSWFEQGDISLNDTIQYQFLVN